MANGSDFPFSIMDVADRLRLNIRRRGGSRVVYADCPICGDRRGKLGLYPEINTWRCYHCGEHGGMLVLYGAVHGVSNSDAYREICAALEVGTPGREYTLAAKTVPAPEADQPQRASPQDIHRTLTALLAMLILSWNCMTGTTGSSSTVIAPGLLLCALTRSRPNPCGMWMRIEIEKERELEKGHAAPAVLGRYQNVILSKRELNELQSDFPTVCQEYIERLSEYMASTGRTYKSHAATIRRWIADDRRKAAPPARDRDYTVKDGDTV